MLTPGIKWPLNNFIVSVWKPDSSFLGLSRSFASCKRKQDCLIQWSLCKSENVFYRKRKIGQNTYENGTSTLMLKDAEKSLLLRMREPIRDLKHQDGRWRRRRHIRETGVAFHLPKHVKQYCVGNLPSLFKKDTTSKIQWKHVDVSKVIYELLVWLLMTREQYTMKNSYFYWSKKFQRTLASHVNTTKTLT